MDLTELKQKANKLLQGALRHAGKAALAGVLLPLAATEARADTMYVPLSGLAVSGTETPNGGGTYTYSYNVSATNVVNGYAVFTLPAGYYNFSGGANKFILPLFHTSDVASVNTTTGWTSQVIAGTPPDWASYYNSAYDPNNLFPATSPPTAYIEWTTNQEGIGEYNNLSQTFSFTSTFGAVNAPFVALYDGVAYPNPYNGVMYPIDTFGDPPIPNSQPQAPPTPPTPPASAGVPEPSTLALFGTAGAALLAFYRRRRVTKETEATPDEGSR